jgi:hypothetical protein
MTITHSVTQEELHIWQERIEPFSVLRIRARVVDDPAFIRPQALLEQIIGPDSTDEQLKQFAHQLRVPVVHEDPVFGKLILDRRVDIYTGQAVWNGARVELDIGIDEAGDLEGGLKVLRDLWRDQKGWTERIANYAVQQLLKVKNDYWLDLDEMPLSAEEFKAKMALDCISVKEDGSFTFWHKDGDMFWGHSIEVRGTLNKGPTSADIPG